MGINKAGFLGRSAHCALIAMSAIGWTTRASAQDAAPQADTQGLEEIVVTAQRRAQNLQDVPVAVTAFTGETLNRSGVQKVLDLGQLDSSLQSQQQAGVVLPFLRGVGNVAGQTAGNESSVPVYIDDIYYTRLYASYLALANVERVEVLKGPQGTLFGRNASGGLIQVVTRDPDKSKTELDATLGYANYDTISGKVYASTPLGDTAAFGLSVVGSKQRDGWGYNPTLDIPTYRDQYISARGKLIWEPTETTRVRLIGFYTWGKTNQGQVQGQVPNRYRSDFNRGEYLNPTVQYVPPSGFYDVGSDNENFTRNTSWGGSLKIEQELGFADLISISSYRRAKELFQSEGDQTSSDVLHYQLNTRDRQITQELQLRSTSTSRISWLLGAYYLNSRQGYDPTRAFGGASPSETFIVGIQRVKSYAGFGQATFPVIDDKTNITLGLRYTGDKVDGFGSIAAGPTNGSPGVPFFVYTDKETFKKLTYKVAVDHKFAEDVLGYVSFSRGYKSGTYNALPLLAPPTRPEVIQAYEIGLKSELFDRRLRLNIAAFQNDISDPQVQLIVVDPLTGVAGAAFSNANKARTKGIEFDALAQAADGLQLRASGQYLYAKYLDFVDAPMTQPLTGIPRYGIATCSAVTQTCDTPGVAYTGPADGASGNRMPMAPKWKLNAGINYNLETEMGDINFDGNVSYRSSVTFEPDNQARQPGFALVDTSLTFTPAALDDHLSVRGWIANLTDRKYYLAIQASNGSVGYMSTPGAPRTYGVEVRYKF